MNTSQWRAGKNVLRAMALLMPALVHLPVRGEAQSKDPALIQIGIEVVEVDEVKTRKLGVQWIDQLLITESAVPSVLKLGELTRSRFAVLLQALEQQGAADLLANPKLVTRDGTTATFHAGGELPYATTSGSDKSVSVEFKPYGVNLKINPRLEVDNRIAIAVEAEVSGPDDQNTVSLSGNIVPGIRSRHISSEVTLHPGSTLTMAGMIQNNKQWTIVGTPGLMHIPVLGIFFRHKVQTTSRTSVIVFITPTLLASENLEPTPRPGVSPEFKESAAEARPPADDLLENLDHAGNEGVKRTAEDRSGDIHG